MSSLGLSEELLQSRRAPGAAAHSGLGLFMEPLGTGAMCPDQPDTFGVAADL